MYQCILRSHTADAEHRANSGTTVPPAGGNQCTVSEHAFRLTAEFFTGGGGEGEGGREEGRIISKGVDCRLSYGICYW